MASERSGTGKGTDAKDKQGSQDPDVLVAEIEATREDLAVTLDAIADRVSPKRVAQRGTERAKEFAANAKVVVSEKAAQAKEVVQERAATAKDTVSEKAAAAKGAANGRVGTSSDASSVAVAGSATPAGADLPPTTGVTVPGLSPQPAPAPTTFGGLPATVGGVPTEAAIGAAAALVALLLLLRRRRGR